MSTLAVFDTLKSGWKLANGIKWQVWRVYLASVGISVGVGLVVALASFFLRHFLGTAGKIIALLLIIAACVFIIGFVYQAIGGMYRVALARARGESVEKLGFSCFTRQLFWRLLAVVIMSSIIVLLITVVFGGVAYLLNLKIFISQTMLVHSTMKSDQVVVTLPDFSLGLFIAQSILFSLLLLLAYLGVSFVIPTVVDQKIGVFAAIKQSFKLAFRQPLRLFGLLAIITILLKISITILPVLFQYLFAPHTASLLAMIITAVFLIWYFPWVIQTKALTYLKLSQKA